MFDHPPIYLDDVLRFGQYRRSGLTMRQVLIINPRYVQKLLDSGIIQLGDDAQEEYEKTMGDAA